MGYRCEHTHRFIPPLEVVTRKLTAKRIGQLLAVNGAVPTIDTFTGSYRGFAGLKEGLAKSFYVNDPKLSQKSGEQDAFEFQF